MLEVQYEMAEVVSFDKGEYFPILALTFYIFHYNGLFSTNNFSRCFQHYF